MTAALATVSAAHRMATVASLLDATGSGTAHPRAAAFLLRRALETRLNTYIAAHRPALHRCRMETKAVWLAHHLDPQLAGRLAAVWHNLSRACHHQQFALPPTIAELRGWRDEVVFVLRALQI